MVAFARHVRQARVSTNIEVDNISARQGEVFETVYDPIIDDRNLYLSIGAIRSGKTFSSTWSFFLYTQKLKKPYLHLIAGRKARMIELEILPLMRFLAELTGAKYNYKSNDQILTIGKQTYIIAAGEDKQSEDRVLGLTIHSSLCDEITLLPETFFTACMSRLSFDESKAWGCANPQGPNHWLKKKWIDTGRCKNLFDFLFGDNPSLGEKVKARYHKQLTGVDKLRWIDGAWAAASGLIWPDRTVKRVQIEPGAECVVPIDYGISISGFACLPIVKIDKEHWHIPESVFIQNSEDRPTPIDSELAEAAWDVIDRYRATRCPIDPSAASLIALMERECDRTVFDYIGKDRKIHRSNCKTLEELKKEHGDVEPIQRNWTCEVFGADNELQVGLRDTAGWLKNENLTIGPGAKEVADDIDSYVWDDKEDGVPHKEGKNQHDLCDAVRYGAMECLFESVGGLNWKEW